VNKTVPFLPELDRRPVLCLLELSLLVRPVAYADFQANAKSNWRVASSVMAGLQFENARIGDRKLQMLAEYFSGPSPNGQFYTQNTEWFGLAATCVTDPLPLHRLRHAGFSGPYSIGRAQVLSKRIAQTGSKHRLRRKTRSPGRA
jgi:hypothetical protein